MRPNVIIIPRPSLAALMFNDQILGRFPRSAGPVTAQMIADKVASSSAFPG
jgi:hypothetical protein